MHLVYNNNNNNNTICIVPEAFLVVSDNETVHKFDFRTCL